MTRKVFILSDGGHDYSDASRFGEVVFCTSGVIRKDDVAQMYREISIALAKAKKDDLILVGALTTLCMVAAGWMVDHFGELHLLLFHNNEYVAKDLFFPSCFDAMETS